MTQTQSLTNSMKSKPLIKETAPRQGDCQLSKTTIGLNFFAVVATLTTTAMFHYLGKNKPFHRGFFCTDDEIRYPYKPDTITTPMLMALSFGPSVLMICLFECLKCLHHTQDFTNLKEQLKQEPGKKVKCFVSRFFIQLILLLFGTALTMLVTEMFKLTAGRLRPNFLAVCQPDPQTVNCSLGYVTNYTCSQTDVSMINDARKSFLSGHASMMFFHMTFVILYLQVRISTRHFPVALLFIQTLAFCLASYVSVTRVTDYKHHGSDVVAGLVLGVTVGVIITRIVNSKMCSRKSCVRELELDSNHAGNIC